MKTIEQKISEESEKEAERMYQEIQKEFKRNTKKETERISWDEYFMNIAEDVSLRSTCRRQVGAVITVDNKIKTTGYNGAPKGLKHCSDMGGCMRQLNNIPSGTQQEFCRAEHAEQNAIIQAATDGNKIKGGTLYVNTYPCSICARMIINAEIKKVVYASDYSDKLAKELFEESGIEIVKYEKKLNK